MRKKTIEDARKLADVRGGCCLSSEYVNASVKMEWRGKEGHSFKMAYCRVAGNHWCRECAIKMRRRDTSLA
jgi:hypothetical protein